MMECSTALVEPCGRPPRQTRVNAVKFSEVTAVLHLATGSTAAMMLLGAAHGDAVPGGWLGGAGCLLAHLAVEASQRLGPSRGSGGGKTEDGGTEDGVDAAAARRFGR